MADDAGPPQPPQGYVLADGRGSFSTHNGPYFYRPGEDELMEQAFFALGRHTNGMGFVHGGMMSAFMDGVLAGAVWRKTGKVGVTVHLSIDYLHIARKGEWVMGEARVTRATNDIAFAEGRAYVGRRDVVRCSGVFKLMKRPR